MNYYLMTRHEVVTNQVTIRYIENQQKLAIILPQEDRIVTFDVPWANDAFFDTMASIGAWLTWNAGDLVRTAVAYENSEGITVKLNGKMWQFEKPKGGAE